MTLEELELRTVTISPADAAERLGCTVESLANRRYRGDPPQFLKVGSRVRYRLSDIAGYLDDVTRFSTSDTGPHAHEKRR